MKLPEEEVERAVRDIASGNGEYTGLVRAAREDGAREMAEWLLERTEWLDAGLRRYGCRAEKIVSQNRIWPNIEPDF